jgi:hypothetical protein
MSRTVVATCHQRTEDIGGELARCHLDVHGSRPERDDAAPRRGSVPSTVLPHARAHMAQPSGHLDVDAVRGVAEVPTYGPERSVVEDLKRHVGKV